MNEENEELEAISKEQAKTLYNDLRGRVNTAVSTLNGAIDGKIDSPETAGAKGQALISDGNGGQNWYKLVVTPQMYGAVGNGVADDTSAIQAALNANKKVYFPQGTYKITEPLVLANGHTVEGDSKYYATISAIGCDCFQIANGDGGERGSIRNIHLQGNLTSGTKGIKLAALAPGWTFVDIWIQNFDYGIYGYQSGHINNIYIDKCIITGKSGTRDFSTCGIYMPNTSNDQINAIVIRDTEINNFATGITINGTAISILQCTIQGFTNGIVIDSSIGYTKNANYCNSSGVTINGCYFEAFNRSAILCSTGFDDNGTIRMAGMINGLQITNNYIYKANDGDNSYAVIRFVGSTTYYQGGRNFGNPNGAEFGTVFIGMNQITKPTACANYDLGNWLSVDSILMHSGQGSSNLDDGLGTKQTGARVIMPGRLTKKTIKRFWQLGTWHNQYVTEIDEKTMQIDAGGVLKISVPDWKINTIDIPIAAATYPCNLFWFVFSRSKEDGRMYTTNANGFAQDYEDKDFVAEANRSATNNQLKDTAVQSDGFCHVGWYAQGSGVTGLSWNSVSGYEIVLFLGANNTSNHLTVKAPTITYWE